MPEIGEFSGLAAVVTGGASGIGLATARHFAARGARVAVLDRDELPEADTIVGVGKVYMVVRASNLLYGLDACAYISSKVKTGYVLDLEGDLTSSNGADRTDAFNACMAANDPGVKVLKEPTVWTDATAVTDAQDAINAYGSKLKAVTWKEPTASSARPGQPGSGTTAVMGSCPAWRPAWPGSAPTGSISRSSTIRTST